jgi:hypothetical protein
MKRLLQAKPIKLHYIFVVIQITSKENVIKSGFQDLDYLSFQLWIYYQFVCFLGLVILYFYVS